MRENSEFRATEIQKALLMQLAETSKLPFPSYPENAPGTCWSKRKLFISVFKWLYTAFLRYESLDGQEMTISTPLL